MKTLLLSLALATAIATPATFLAERAGIDLPDWFDSLHVLGGFVGAFATLMLFGGYSRSFASRNPVAVANEKSPHRLAA